MTWAKIVIIVFWCIRGFQNFTRETDEDENPLLSLFITLLAFVISGIIYYYAGIFTFD